MVDSWVLVRQHLQVLSAGLQPHSLSANEKVASTLLSVRRQLHVRVTVATLLTTVVTFTQAQSEAVEVALQTMGLGTQQVH